MLVVTRVRMLCVRVRALGSVRLVGNMRLRLVRLPGSRLCRLIIGGHSDRAWTRSLLRIWAARRFGRGLVGRVARRRAWRRRERLLRRCGTCALMLVTS